MGVCIFVLFLQNFSIFPTFSLEFGFRLFAKLFKWCWMEKNHRYFNQTCLKGEEQMTPGQTWCCHKMYHSSINRWIFHSINNISLLFSNISDTNYLNLYIFTWRQNVQVYSKYWNIWLLKWNRIVSQFFSCFGRKVEFLCLFVFLCRKIECMRFWWMCIFV